MLDNLFNYIWFNLGDVLFNLTQIATFSLIWISLVVCARCWLLDTSLLTSRRALQIVHNEKLNAVTIVILFYLIPIGYCLKTFMYQ